MKQILKISSVLFLLALVATTLWALADSKSVTFLFEPAWEKDAELPGGGVIVSRGEGTNGVISVDLPLPPPSMSSEGPIELGADEVTYMDITVEDEDGVVRHYTDEHIRTVNYRIDLEHEWDNGVIQKYRVINMVEEKQ